MKSEKFNLQDRLLNIVRISQVPVAIVFDGGFKVEGIVKSYDDFTLLLESKDEQMLIYKHAIKSIDPLKYVNVFKTK